jgi:integrase
MYKKAKPARRARGAGSVRESKNGLFEARISVQVDGKRKQVSRYFPTEVEAWDSLASMRAEHHAETTRDRTTFEGVVAAWLRTAKSTTAPRTYQRYECISRLHLTPTFGPREVATITRRDVNDFMDKLAEKGLTPSNRANALAMLVRVLNRAVDDEITPRNVALGIDPPRREKQRRTILTEAQVKKVLAAARGDRFYALIVLAVASGLRQGELLALHWDDVNLDDRRVTVHHSLSRNLDGELYRKTTKTNRSRSVDISSSAAMALRQHREAQKAKGYDGPLVFPNQVGEPINKENFMRRYWYPLLKRAEVPATTFHGLRHFSNSIAIARGASILVAQQRGGWASSRMVLDQYGHLLDGQQREAADSLNDLL